MFPSKHLSKQYLFKTWPCPSWDGLWAFVGFGLLGLGLGLGLYLLQRLTRKTLNVKANDLVLHYKKPPLVDSHHRGSYHIFPPIVAIVPGTVLSQQGPAAGLLRSV